MKKMTVFFACISLCTTPVLCADDINDCDDRGAFFLEADWLYWKAIQDNLGFSTISTQVVDGDLTTANSNLIEQKFKYDSGFRTNIGYRPKCSCWEIALDFTYLPSNSHASKSIAASNQFITAYKDNIAFFKLIENMPFDTMDSKWNLNLYYVDIDLAYTFTCCDCFHLKPHAGIRYLNFREKLTVDLRSITTRGGINVVDDFKFNQQTHGIGLEGGLDTRWDFRCGTYLRGSFVGSILYANFHTKGRLNQSTDDAGDITLLNNSYKGKINSAIPTLNYFLGLGYAGSICNYTFFLEAGWEQFVLLNANRIAQNGNLSFEGFTLKGGFAF